MRRLPALALVLAVILSILTAPSASARVRKVKHGARARSVVVVHAGWPLRRPLRAVVIHPVRRPVGVVTARFLVPPIVWVSATLPPPPPDRILWQDGETIGGDEGWAEVTLNVERSGKRLELEVRGRAALDFAEVVYDNGEAHVVDFKGKSVGPGIYPFLDTRDRTVDHVRIVARASGDEARLVLLSLS